MLKSVLSSIGRIVRARRFDVPFLRRASFRMPEAIRLGKASVRIAHPQDRGVANDFLGCFIDDGYGLSRIRRPLTAIADIGANVGFFSMAARSYFPNATIHAYEPNPRILPFATENASSARFQLYAEAVGARVGSVFIEDAGDSNQARTVASGGSGCQIPQVSLATVVERLGGHVDLAKIDCEGAEWEMFTDSAPWRAISLVRMEYHLWGRHDFQEVRASFERVGFEIEYHVSSGEWGTVWCRNLHG